MVLGKRRSRWVVRHSPGRYPLLPPSHGLRMRMDKKRKAIWTLGGMDRPSFSRPCLPFFAGSVSYLPRYLSTSLATTYPNLKLAVTGLADGNRVHWCD